MKHKFLLIVFLSLPLWLYSNDNIELVLGGYSRSDSIISDSLRNQLLWKIGGNISTSSPTQGYVGIDYNNFNLFPVNVWADIQVGQVYNAVTTGLRLKVMKHLYIDAIGLAQQFNYYDDNQFFYFGTPMIRFRQREFYGKVQVVCPLGTRVQIKAGGGVCYSVDKYMQTTEEFLVENKSDRSRYLLADFYVSIGGSSLNDDIHPTRGHQWSVTLHNSGGNEKAVSVIYPQNNRQLEMKWWIDGKGHWDGYFPFGKHFSLGVEAEVIWSMRPMLGNYTATMIQSPRFAPTTHSKIVYNSSFVAKQYGAIGLKPIVLIKPNWQVRLEGYVFAPVFTIKNDTEDNTAYYSPAFQNVRFLTEASMIYRFRIGTAAIYANYYSQPANDWNIGVNFGILLFHHKFLE